MVIIIIVVLLVIYFVFVGKRGAEAEAPEVAPGMPPAMPGGMRTGWEMAPPTQEPMPTEPGTLPPIQPIEESMLIPEPEQMQYLGRCPQCGHRMYGTSECFHCAMTALSKGPPVW
jgi:hypothetical protein